MGIRINNIEDFIEEVDTKSIFEELLEDAEDDYEDEYYRERKSKYKSEKDLAHELEGIPVEKKSSRKTRVLELSDNIFEVNKYDRGLIFGNETVVSTRSKRKQSYLNDNDVDDKSNVDERKEDISEKQFSIEDLDFEVVSLIDKANKHVPRYERKLEKKKRYIEERRNNPNKRVDRENVRLKSIFDKLDNDGYVVSSSLNRACVGSIPKLDLSFLRFDNLTDSESDAVESMFKWITDSVSDDTIPNNIRCSIFKIINKFTKTASKNNFLSWMQVIHSISTALTKSMKGMKLLMMVCNKLSEYSSKYILASRPSVLCRNIETKEKEVKQSYFNEDTFNELANDIYEILY